MEKISKSGSISSKNNLQSKGYQKIIKVLKYIKYRE